VYIHKDIAEGPEVAFIDYAKGGGKLVLLHHSISSGKRKNKYWLPFLGVELPDKPFDQGGYKYFDPATFQIVKVYGNQWAPYKRAIAKPVAGTVTIAVAGAVQTEGASYGVDYTTGQVTFAAAAIPVVGATITAGFEFDVPVRFDTDKIEVNLQNFAAGSLPHIPITEVRL